MAFFSIIVMRFFVAVVCSSEKVVESAAEILLDIAHRCCHDHLPPCLAFHSQLLESLAFPGFHGPIKVDPSGHHRATDPLRMHMRLPTSLSSLQQPFLLLLTNLSCRRPLWLLRLFTVEQICRRWIFPAATEREARSRTASCSC